MKAALKRICELQPSYTDTNTPEMQERGHQLRHILRPAIKDLEDVLAPALGEFGNDLLVDASDGIGRKTELPWVRFSSGRMSPKPTEGFYCVIHFSTDGSAVHVTVGCGSSRFHKGSSVVLPDEELDAQTAWAKSIVLENLHTLEPFSDPPDFGAKRPLPKSFQRATALSKRVPYEQIDQTDIEGLLVAAAERLRLIYSAQLAGRDLTPADQDELAITSIIAPTHAAGSRQGFGLPAAAKRQVELRAMVAAKAWLLAEGYSVKDRSANHPFDFEATRDGVSLKVEVKGTTSDRADAVLMTANEVALHLSEQGATALIIVSGIRLTRADEAYLAEGGAVEPHIGWNIQEWLLEPTAYRVTRKSKT